MYLRSDRRGKQERVVETATSRRACPRENRRLILGDASDGILHHYLKPYCITARWRSDLVCRIDMSTRRADNAGEHVPSVEWV